jgi:hypothetical protein
VIPDKTEQAFQRFLELPKYSGQPDRVHATQASPRFEIRTMRATASGDPHKEDLAAVVYLSENNKRIRRANPDLTPARREALYTLWFQGNRDVFALLERIPPDPEGVSIIGNTTILPLEQQTMDRLSRAELAVIHLRDTDICGSRAHFDVLLFDSWVMHFDYQGINRHSGYGNALVLKHLSMFWDLTSQPALRLYAEPDTRSMLDMLPRLGFREQGETQAREPLFAFEYPPTGPSDLENVLQRRYIREVVEQVQQCRSW